jgi:hypothetical protein
LCEVQKRAASERRCRGGRGESEASGDDDETGLSQPGGIGVVVIREEVLAAIDVVADEARLFERACKDWRRVVARRDRLVAKAQRKVAIAAGGNGPRYLDLSCGHGRINTRAEAMAFARALRAGPSVNAAVVDAEKLRSREDAAVLAARVELAVATKQVLRRGILGQQLTGLGRADLRRFARLPVTGVALLPD